MTDRVVLPVLGHALVPNLPLPGWSLPIAAELSLWLRHRGWWDLRRRVVVEERYCRRETVNLA